MTDAAKRLKEFKPKKVFFVVGKSGVGKSGDTILISSDILNFKLPAVR